MKLIKSAYFDRFHCLATKCPDSCCKEWELEIDEETAQKYRALPGDLGDTLRRVLADEAGQTVMRIENGRCPMWRQDGLCQIQAQLGEEALCKVCREFPRLTHNYGDFVELGLELSCPEAARLILTQPPQAPVVEEIPGGAPGEYDKEVMEILLQTRQEAFSLLDNADHSCPEALVLLLMYAYHAQALVDGVDTPSFSTRKALQAARTFAKPADKTALLSFYKGLEVLTDTWRNRLDSPAPGLWSAPLRAMARYGVERYWLQAVSDYDLAGRVKMVLAGCVVVKALGGNAVATAQLYAKEIENNCDNVEAILDAAYKNPAFTDDKLLWLLLEE